MDYHFFFFLLSFFFLALLVLWQNEYGLEGRVEEKRRETKDGGKKHRGKGGGQK